MNIISNTCVGAGIYKNCLNKPYSNPFMWNLIDYDSMYKLIKNYDKINFKNIKVEKLNKEVNNSYAVIIDNSITIKYIHYRYDKTKTEPEIKGVDVFYNKIEEYIKEKYLTRLKLMKEKPVFIVGSIIKQQLYTEEQIRNICKINSPYKIIIANNNIDLSKEFPKILFYKYKNPIETYGISNCLLGKELFVKYNQILNK